MEKDFLKDKLKNLKQAKAENKVQHRWQDAVLSFSQELSLPRTIQTDRSKRPLNVYAMLMRHAKQNTPVFERRMSVVREKGLGGESAVKYYMGIVESESDSTNQS